MSFAVSIRMSESDSPVYRMTAIVSAISRARASSLRLFSGSSGPVHNANCEVYSEHSFLPFERGIVSHILDFESQRRLSEPFPHISELILKFPLSIPFVSCSTRTRNSGDDCGRTSKKEVGQHRSCRGEEHDADRRGFVGMPCMERDAGGSSAKGRRRSIGPVLLHVKELDGTEHMLEVPAKR
jgi:hypothetical protein